jgi:cytochrome c553
MKRILSVSFVIAFVIIACSRNTIANKEPVIPRRETFTSVPDSTTIISAPVVELTDAASIALGKTVFETRCGRCHGLKNTADYTSQRWEGILRSMAPKARLTQTEIQQVTAYVKANSKK